MYRPVPSTPLGDTQLQYLGANRIMDNKKHIALLTIKNQAHRINMYCSMQSLRVRSKAAQNSLTKPVG